MLMEKLLALCIIINFHMVVNAQNSMEKKLTTLTRHANKAALKVKTKQQSSRHYRTKSGHDKRLSSSRQNFTISRHGQQNSR